MSCASSFLRSGDVLCCQKVGDSVNCKQACRKLPSFLDGSYPLKKQAPLLKHLETCRHCRKELAIAYRFDRALEALDDPDSDFDFINEGSEELALRILKKRQQEFEEDRNREYERLSLYVITFWSVLVTLVLQVIYWYSTGFWFFHR